MIDIFYTGHGKRWPTAETNQTNSFEPVFISQFVDIRRFLWQGFLDTLGKLILYLQKFVSMLSILFWDWIVRNDGKKIKKKSKDNVFQWN